MSSSLTQTLTTGLVEVLVGGTRISTRCFQYIMIVRSPTVSRELIDDLSFIYFYSYMILPYLDSVSLISTTG